VVVPPRRLPPDAQTIAVLPVPATAGEAVVEDR
jgi:hypothetical protein